MLLKYRSLNYARICCKACRKQLKHERLVWGETWDCFLSALQQTRAQSRLLYLFYNKKSFKFPTHYFQFSKHTLFPKWTTVSSIMSNHQSCQSAIVYRLKWFGRFNFKTLLPEFFKSLKQNLKVKCSVKSGQIEAHNNMQFFSNDN